MSCLKWSLGVACVALLCAGASGQEKRTDKPPGKVEQLLSPKVIAKLKEQTRDIDIGAKPAASGVKDLDELLKILDDLGYEPKMEEYMGNKYVRIPSSWVVVQMSDDGSLIFINDWVPKWEDLASVKQDSLLGILEAGGGFANFFYASKAQQLCCASILESKLVTKAALRKRIDAVTSLYLEAKPLWNLPK